MAAGNALVVWRHPGCQGSRALVGVNVDVQDQSSREDPYGWVTVTVRATYRCTVPMGFIACGGATKQLQESYRMPHQGAIYEM